MYTVDRKYEGLTIRLAECETLREATAVIEEDMLKHGEGVVYHMERDDKKGIGDEIAYE